ncbi:hypothetical protein QJS04_geneDACA016205 [Acorus gramineus]|uniref:GTP cyclohydrolase 1 n=1 Tax=Acorus gramineus TaxID=55184 RepID=A0AAV9B099_ACOGR|nr:hypothetical protein QJS04_geneDACA019699 [Acorus gramineus]KAK1272187.1 hypothetical protein QJS04_geneDACA016205 [Acorus gramineus]
MGALGEGCRYLVGDFETEGSKLRFFEVGLCADSELDGGEAGDGGVGGGGGGEEDVVIEDAVRVLLKGLGEDCEREGIKKTPRRVARALREGTRGYRKKAEDIVHDALFPEASLEGGTSHPLGKSMHVAVRDTILFSYCESCLLPFKVECHIGYIPSKQRVVGLSKLPRVAEVFAKRLQNPRRLVDDICSALHQSIKSAGVAVVLQCWHIQIPKEEMKGSDELHSHTLKLGMQNWNSMFVHSGSGVFEDQTSVFWRDFLFVARLRGVIGTNDFQDWCPMRPHEISSCIGHYNDMVDAAAAILRSLGEDPLRKELVGTPQRFVKWLMNFQRSNLEMKEIQHELNLQFWSQCEHHLLPFHGMVHIGYIDIEGNSINRSVLQSIVHFFGCKLQVQERLTRQIAEAVSSIVSGGVIVMVEAIHICMVSRGIEKVGSTTGTMVSMGQFSSDVDAKEKFQEIVWNNPNH